MLILVLVLTLMMLLSGQSNSWQSFRGDVNVSCHNSLAPVEVNSQMISFRCSFRRFQAYPMYSYQTHPR